MKTIFLYPLIFTLLLCFSISNNIYSKTNTYNSNVTAEKDTFNVNRYRKLIDSLALVIEKKKLNLSVKIHHLRKNELVFEELKSTAISNIISKSICCVKYNFYSTNKAERLFQHLVIVIDFKSDKIADSIFLAINNVALEKSGIPGLTYTYDYIIRIKNKIYWLNSKCWLRKETHQKLVESFKKMLNITKTQTIKCDCGEVQCRNLFE